ncbi:MAG: transaldolase [Actinomycetota bacterium]|nr:MAG: transaldolase [Actinomycetota bacterium]
MSEYKKSAMQRLSETSDVMEIWWDSSPLVFNKWKNSVLEKAKPEDREKLEAQLKVLFDADKPGDCLFDGVTTNPKLTNTALGLLSSEMDPVIDEIIAGNKAKSNYLLAWKTYKEMTRTGAALYMPLFEKSNYKKGYVSAQVDPHMVTDIKKMLHQALELKEISDNIMVKCPGSHEGIYLTEILTSLGIPTNETLVFHIPQVVAVAEAVKKGLETGKRNGVDYSQWRSVITIMIGRFEGMPEFSQSAASVGIELTEELKRWSGIAIAKKAHSILNDPSNGYSSKLLLCSARPGPGEGNIYHIEKVAGGNMVYTLNPEIIEDFMAICAKKDVYSQMDDPVPDRIMEKLTKIPYFSQGYEVDGMARADFVDHPSFIMTREQFSGSMKEIEEYIVKRKSKK